MSGGWAFPLEHDHYLTYMLVPIIPNYCMEFRVMNCVPMTLSCHNPLFPRHSWCSHWIKRCSLHHLLSSRGVLQVPKPCLSCIDLASRLFKAPALGHHHSTQWWFTCIVKLHYCLFWSFAHFLYYDSTIVMSFSSVENMVSSLEDSSSSEQLSSNNSNDDYRQVFGLGSTQGKPHMPG